MITPENSTNMELERAILSKILREPETAYAVVGKIKSNQFSASQHKTIFWAIETLVDETAEPNYLLVKSKLDSHSKLENAGGEEYLKDLYESDLKIEDVSDIVDRVIKISLLTEINILGFEMSRLNKSHTEDIESRISQISQQLDNLIIGSVGNQTESIQDVLRDEWADFEKLLEKPGITGISTGNSSLDLMLSGYNPTNLIILAARTGVGKSSFALRQMLNMAKENIPTMMFSYEMSKKELSQRMVSMESGVPLLSIRTGNVTDKELEVIKDTYLKVSTYPIHLDTSANDSLSYLLSTIRRYVRTHGVKVVFVDYLQLMARDSANETRDLGKITRALKLLAMELEIVVIALSQLNRGLESRDNKRPQLFDLRQSGNIEEDGNVVIMLYRPALAGVKMKDEDEFLCEILVRKNRNGPLGAINAYFKADTADVVNSLTEIIRSLK